jgi:8-oxo-dGTP diphosphatase
MPTIEPDRNATDAKEQKLSLDNPVVLVVSVALIDEDGKILLAQRPDEKHMSGLWEFPGGKVEEGETPEIALVREIKEELGIDVSESCLAPFSFSSYAYDDFHLLMPIYLCRVWKGIPKPKEQQKLKWVKLEDFDNYTMPPADIPLIAMLKEFL